MTRDDAAEVRLLALPRREGTEELRVALRSYRGTTFVDVRTWYQDRASGEWKPGKGCAIRTSEIAKVADALAEAATRITRDEQTEARSRHGR